jgi:hypothetical protein
MLRCERFADVIRETIGDLPVASGLQQARQKETQRQLQSEENESPPLYLLSASAMGLSRDGLDPL